MIPFVSTVPHSLRIGENGNLGIIEFIDLPFQPKRVYWLSGVQDGKSRGYHAHKKLKQFLVMIQGSVEVRLTNGNAESLVTLRANGEGVVLAPGLWREIRNFSENAVLLVICDQVYSESDYIRDFNQYLEWIKTDD